MAYFRMKQINPEAYPLVAQINPEVYPLVTHLNVFMMNSDWKRLAAPLRTWNHLSHLLSLDQFPLLDLKKMLVVELNGKRRGIVLEKLTSRIATTETAHIRRIIEYALYNHRLLGVANSVALPLRAPRPKTTSAKEDIPAQARRQKRRARQSG